MKHNEFTFQLSCILGTLRTWNVPPNAQHWYKITKPSLKYMLMNGKDVQRWEHLFDITHVCTISLGWSNSKIRPSIRSCKLLMTSRSVIVTFELLHWRLQSGEWNSRFGGVFKEERQRYLIRQIPKRERGERNFIKLWRRWG